MGFTFTRASHLKFDLQGGVFGCVPEKFSVHVGVLALEWTDRPHAGKAVVIQVGNLRAWVDLHLAISKIIFSCQYKV